MDEQQKTKQKKKQSETFLIEDSRVDNLIKQLDQEKQLKQFKKEQKIKEKSLKKEVKQTKQKEYDDLFDQMKQFLNTHKKEEETKKEQQVEQLQQQNQKMKLEVVEMKNDLQSRLERAGLIKK